MRTWGRKPILSWLALGTACLLLFGYRILPLDNGAIFLWAWLCVPAALSAFRTGRGFLLSLAAILACLALAEGGLALQRSLFSRTEIYRTTAPYGRPDPALGWSAVPGARALVTKTDFRGTDIFREVGYFFDRKGRRTGPGRPASGKEHALVFGGSFAFGHGLDWPKSLSARLEGLSPGRYQAYCYALDAYGPGQMKEQLAGGADFGDVAQKSGLACYWFIPHHLARNVLLYDLPTMIQTWSRSIYYGLDHDGRLTGPVLIQDDPKAHRVVRWFHRGMRFSPLFQYLWSIVQPRIFVSPKKAAEITARLIIRAAQSYHERFQGRFVVIMTPQILWQGRGFPIPEQAMKQFKARLIQAGVEILVISEQKEENILFNQADRDGHPSAAYYDIVAREVLKWAAGK